MEVTKGIFGELPPLAVVGIKGYSEKGIHKWCPDSLVVISFVPLALGTHHSLLQSLISYWVQGNWPIMMKLHLHFTLHFPCMSPSNLHGRILDGGISGTSSYFCSASNQRIVFLLQTLHRHDAHTCVFARVISLLVKGRNSFSLSQKF